MVDRASIDHIFKWNIDNMYNTPESLKEDIKKVEMFIAELKSYKGKLADNKDNLYQGT